MVPFKANTSRLTADSTLLTKMDETTYQTGYEAGEYWAKQDASRVQMFLIHEFGDGKVWVTRQRYAVEEFVRIIDPSVIDFMRTREPPSDSYLAGFIDGARAIEPATD